MAINKKQPIKVVNNTEEGKNRNVVTLFFIFAFLIIDFFPSFESIDIIAPQFLYLSVLNIIVGFYLYFNSVAISDSIVYTLKRNPIFIAYLAFLTLSLVSIFVANNLSLSIVRYIQLLVSFGMAVNLILLLYKKLNLIYQIAILVALSATIQCIGQLHHLYTAPSIMEGLLNLKGNTGNINFFASSLNVKIPFIILGLSFSQGLKKYFYVFALIIVSLCIFLSGSRGALVGFTGQMLVFLILYTKINSFKKPSLLQTIWILIPIAIAIVGANQIFKPIGQQTDHRYESVVNRITQIGTIDTSESSSTGTRLGNYKNALRLVAKHPIIGVGIGNWRVESIPYEKYLSTGDNISGNTHNDFLELAAETGIVNALIYIAIFVLLFLFNIRNVFSKAEHPTKIISIVTLMILFGYLADAMFSFPLYRPPMQFMFGMMIAFTILNLTVEDKRIQGTKMVKTFVIGAIVLTSITIYYAKATFKTYVLENYVKSDYINIEHNPALSADYILQRVPFYPTVCMSGEPILEYVGAYYYHAKQYDEALKFFDLADKINPYLYRTYWYRYKIAYAQGNIDKGYDYIKKAFYNRPKNHGFFLDAIYMANVKHDTLGMLKIHDIYEAASPSPKNWLITSNALSVSKYNNQKLIKFIDKGLVAFPNDSSLLAKKDFFIHNKSNDLLIDAEQFGRENRYDKALELYQKAIKIDPEKAIIKRNIGICFSQLGKFKEAIPYFLMYMSTQKTSDGTTEYITGVCYLNIKDKKNACKYLTIAALKKISKASELLASNCP